MKQNIAIVILRILYHVSILNNANHYQLLICSVALVVPLYQSCNRGVDGRNFEHYQSARLQMATEQDCHTAVFGDAYWYDSGCSEWARRQNFDELQKQFAQNGIVVVENMIDQDDVEKYKNLYQQILDGKIDTRCHRHDLGDHEELKTAAENICQVMWPSKFVPCLRQGAVHERGSVLARELLGADMAFDFDMLISKAPHTATPTPWHQDESYWPDLPDKRALSIWVAIDRTTVDNGCMWFVDGSHLEQQLRPHRVVAAGKHTRITDSCSELDGRPRPLQPGACTAHHGRTLHYSRGNCTDQPRRGFIVNFRPQSMIDRERQMGFNHGFDGVNKLI